MRIFPPNRAVLLGFWLTTLLLLASCRSDATRDAQATPVIVVDRVVYANGWKSCGTIRVQSDGRYIYTAVYLWTPGCPKAEFHGRIPPQMVSDLRDVAKGRGVELVGKIPTYKYYVDEHHFRQPDAVKQLQALVLSAHRADQRNAPAK